MFASPPTLLQGQRCMYRKEPGWSIGRLSGRARTRNNEGTLSSVYLPKRMDYNPRSLFTPLTHIKEKARLERKKRSNNKNFTPISHVKTARDAKKKIKKEMVPLVQTH